MSAWTVLLIGGSSGAGKTSVSYRIAKHFGAGITEVDDFQVILEKMTTPEQQPILHRWTTDPQAPLMSADQMLEHMLAIGRVMTPALEAVIANHLETDTPIVLEGDFIQPAMAIQASYDGQAHEGRVRAVFIHEPDEAQIVENYLQREPHYGLQTRRAHDSWRYGEWLKAEGMRHGVPVVESRPWDTLLERVIKAIAEF